MEKMILIEKAPYEIIEDSRVIMTKNSYDELHSYYGMPSIEMKVEKTLFWHKNGKNHNTNDRPYSIKALSTEVWMGVSYNHLSWYVDGKLHRNSDKPSIIGINGDMIWFKNGEIHRGLDKPSIISNITESKAWVKNDLFYKRKNNKPNLIIGDNLFWVDGPLINNTLIDAVNITILKHRQRNKFDKFLEKKAYIYAFGISFIIYALVVIFGS